MGHGGIKAEEKRVGLLVEQCDRLVSQDMCLGQILINARIFKCLTDLYKSKKKSPRARHKEPEAGSTWIDTVAGT